MWGNCEECGAQRRNRTADTSLFRALLYRLSYLGAKKSCQNYRSIPPESNPNPRKELIPSRKLRTSSAEVGPHIWIITAPDDVIDEVMVDIEEDREGEEVAGGSVDFRGEEAEGVEVLRHPLECEPTHNK
jgi:hypothetical protein